MQAALDRLSADFLSAAATLGFLSRQGKSESVRLQAAKALIDAGSRLRESVELDERLTALESKGAKR